MPPLKNALRATALTTILGATFLYNRTKNSTITAPLDPNDPIFQNRFYLKNNPHLNPSTQDVCVRRVPAGKIKPGLVLAFLKAQEEGRLGEEEGKGGVLEQVKEKVQKAVEEVKGETGNGSTTGEEYGLIEGFCAGVWSGLGYQFQRRYLSRKYQHLTPNQLWSRQELKESKYDVGTHITDHFEILSKTPSSILIRCGDSPLNSGLRDTDGLFELGVKVVEEPITGWSGTLGAKERFVEFSLKSVFYPGLTKVKEGEGGMPYPIELLHRLYSKILMETAIYNVM